MSLQIAAQHLARKGRGPDTELVHMTKGEVAGLQALAVKMGGTLTVNPDTGLVEASFLKKLLPMLASAAAIYLTGGAAGVGAFGMGSAATGALAGGLTGALVNPNNRLMGGIMGGIGGYTMGGMGDVLADQGAQFAMVGQPAVAAGQGLNAAIPMSYADKLGAGVSSLGQPGGMSAFIGDAATKISPATGLGGGWATAGKLGGMFAPMFSSEPGKLNAPGQKPSHITPFEFTRNTDISDPLNPRVNQYYTAGTPFEAPGPAGYPYQPGQRIQMAEGGIVGGDAEMIPTYDFTRTVDTSDPLNPRVNQAFTKLPVAQPVLPPGGQGIAQNIGGGGSDGGYDNTPDAWSMLSPAEQAQFYGGNPTMAGITQMGQNLWGLTPMGMAQNYMNPGFVQAQQSIAQGNDPTASFGPDFGAAVDAVGMDAALGGVAEGVSSAEGTGIDSLAHGGLIRKFNAGGISSLGSYSDGGRLTRGPGDGVSDSIPATIGANQQPARLADGEFVLPSRIVSELGNGSTEAGSRKLYAMMDRIQAGRGTTVGKGQVAKNSRADRYLPA